MFSDSLKKARIAKGFSQQALARQLCISQQAYAQYETGRSSPNPEVLKKISEILDVSVDLLLENNISPSNDSSGVWINVLGRVAAGVPLEAIEEILDQEEITHEMASKGDFFGLKIKGDSMEPKFSDGDTVIVRKQSDIESGDIAIILINGEDAVCKKVLKNSNGIALVSTNPAYDPLYYSAQEVADLPVVILGKVVELRAKF